MRTQEGRHVTQRRVSQGYVMAREVPCDQVTAGKLCGTCRHFAMVFKPRCAHGDFAVMANAACSLWTPATPTSVGRKKSLR